MRLCMISASFARWQDDFSGRQIYEMAYHLAARGHSVSVVAPHQPRAQSSEQMHGPEVR